MAKISFTKLGLTKKQDIVTTFISEQPVDIKQYLPINDKLTLISEAINKSSDNNNFLNPIKFEVFLDLAIIDYYTNISFTEKQKEDPCKLYDLMKESGVIQEVKEAIPYEELNQLIIGAKQCIEEIYKYRNSVMGILDTVSSDYSNLSLDAANIQEKIADPDNLELLRSVLTKLG